MFLYNTLFFLVASVFVFGETALVDKFKKCSVKDNECLKGIYQSLVDTLAKDGAPELGIDKIDPIGIKDVSVQVLGILNVSLAEGTVEGIKSCQITGYTNEIEAGKSSLHALCDKMTFTGGYKLEVFGPLLQASGLDVQNTHGNGDVKIVLEKVDLRLDFPYSLEKKDDGVYFKLDKANTKYSLDVLEKATFEADNVIDGNPEASKVAITYLNENWKLILKTLGKDFFDKVVEYINFYADKFFDNVATEHFITEDLSSYIKK